MHLFVYGTLLTVADHPMGRKLHEASDFVGSGWIRACLYHIEDPEEPGNRYPGAVPSGYDDDRVYGELYALHDAEALLPAFDRYEACDPSRPEPHEFQRREIPVTLENARVIPAVSYLYAWDLSRAGRIPSGRITEAMPSAR
ncbi:gamma-glutamylcyclotransferase [Mameliella alba]|nr:gamma-glutamylcyclotransferase [Antarctobacter heliothermus]MBY6143115.1 gamma-glutamylcyclotransferase [Mameliella alba]MCA0953161.1 gamma-glutamylcyclotransferase [Mameliella alba]